MWRIFTEKSNYPNFLHIRMARLLYNGYGVFLGSKATEGWR